MPEAYSRLSKTDHLEGVAGILMRFGEPCQSNSGMEANREGTHDCGGVLKAVNFCEIALLVVARVVAAFMHGPTQKPEMN
jgi:hypothetical protein